MYQQFNEQFTAATRQFADTAAQINRLSLQNAEAVFGLQFAAVNERMNATFAFFNEATQVRDMDGAKALLPKGVQVARENVERAVATTQDVFARTVKSNESIGEIAKTQLESAARDTQKNVETATRTVQANAQTVARATQQNVDNATRTVQANADELAKNVNKTVNNAK